MDVYIDIEIIIVYNYWKWSRAVKGKTEKGGACNRYHSEAILNCLNQEAFGLIWEYLPYETTMCFTTNKEVNFRYSFKCMIN